jgi:hypothetical protein
LYDNKNLINRENMIVTANDEYYLFDIN